MEDIFSARMTYIYFVYGLAFFSLGLTVALELRWTHDIRFKRALRFLAIFGLVHGCHEWFEMFLIIAQEKYSYVLPLWMEWMRIGVLAFTFCCLGAFGLLLIQPRKKMISKTAISGVIIISIYVLCFFLLGAWADWVETEWLQVTDTWTRYSLGMPGALLAAGGLLIKRNSFLHNNLKTYRNSLTWAALAFGLYGLIGQFIAAPSSLFPATIINSETFLGFFNFPIQVYRTFMAVLAAFFIIRALRGFDVNRRKQLELAQNEATAAIARRDALRGELYHRTVTAQEEERTRIARELHDEIGQMLTGLSTGLRGVQKSVANDPERAQKQLQELEMMNVRAIKELSQLVADLRPSLLDNMGLGAALDWYISQVNQRGSMQILLKLDKSIPRFHDQIETTLFRISQEAITNILRHSQASHAELELICDRKWVRLRISDNGIGFDPEVISTGKTPLGWGLAGIQERSQLIGGKCHIRSAKGKGMTLKVEIPIQISKDGEDE